ncbi:hypothetical protein [Paenibacillus lactis]|uniref:Uncharacterized protein n=2 Tax=Paenibacillus lactis TaxID=228574 RepID=G4HHX7_9BACL|nr:hypothetical protein [Paenibacillus lactis]EHB62950.1 hypothetical protein PaelaDRAFT_3588 [Paenibacillus lactis 154]MBP1894677.1 hypothetical protein [Paenibacillus lactis]HAG00144.1 hypothetical protein [Paenibacillus lactis]
MLENERYGEAMEVLRFLLQCSGQNERNYEEWRALLEWLEAAFPEAAVPRENDADTEEIDDPDEAEMTRQMVNDKVAQDAGYADKLLASVMNGPLTEQTILALEQLAYLDRPEIDAALADWLSETPLHPLLQFRVLQTLRRRGMEGSVTLKRGQEAVEIEIDSVPLDPSEFPPAITRILERVADQTEVHEPTLFYFAQELWSQFIMAIYGTLDYESMLDEDESTLDIWAAALHDIVSESLKGFRNEDEIRPLYGITDTMRFRYEGAYRSLKQFVAAGAEE